MVEHFLPLVLVWGGVAIHSCSWSSGTTRTIRTHLLLHNRGQPCQVASSTSIGARRVGTCPLCSRTSHRWWWQRSWESASWASPGTSHLSRFLFSFLFSFFHFLFFYVFHFYFLFSFCFFKFLMCFYFDVLFSFPSMCYFILIFFSFYIWILFFCVMSERFFLDLWTINLNLSNIRFELVNIFQNHFNIIWNSQTIFLYSQKSLTMQTFLWTRAKKKNSIVRIFLNLMISLTLKTFS